MNTDPTQTKQTPRPRGAAAYTPDKGKRICNLIAVGSSMSKAAREEKVAPSTIYSWLATHDDFAALYERAQAKKARLIEKTIAALELDAQKTALEVKEKNRKLYEINKAIHRFKKTLQQLRGDDDDGGDGD